MIKRECVTSHWGEVLCGLTPALSPTSPGFRSVHPHPRGATGSGSGPWCATASKGSVATTTEGCKWWNKASAGCKHPGWRGGGRTISLVHGNVTNLGATLWPNLLRIHSWTCQRVGLSPPVNSGPPRLFLLGNKRGPLGVPLHDHSQLNDVVRPFHYLHPTVPCAHTRQISPKLLDCPLRLPLAGASPPKNFRRYLSPPKHPQAPDSDLAWPPTSQPSPGGFAGSPLPP